MDASLIIETGRLPRLTPLPFPRSWRNGDMEWTIQPDGSLTSVYLPEENPKRMLVACQAAEKRYLKNRDPRQDSALKERFDWLRELHDALHEEDMRRIDACREAGITRADFRKLLFLNQNPGFSSVGSIYVIRQTGFPIFKVGISNVPERRLMEVNTGNPYGGELLMYFTGTDYAGREQLLHAWLDDYRIRPNGEWFEFGSEHQADAFLTEIEEHFRLWKEYDDEFLEWLQLEHPGRGLFKGPFESWSPRLEDERKRLSFRRTD